MRIAPYPLHLPLLVFGLLVSLGGVTSDASAADLSAARDVARTVAGPDFELLGLDGELHRLADARGRVLIVNFWATWCISCRSEMPALNSLYREFADTGVVVYGISTDEEGAVKVVPYVDELGLEYPILLDPEAVSTKIFGGLEGYPMTYIFDREGLIYSSYLGAQDEATFREDVEYLLGAESSPGAPLLLGEPDESGLER